MTGLQPLGARVLVAPLQPPTVSESGIELIEQRVPETMGTVVAVGHGWHPVIEELRQALGAAAQICDDFEAAEGWMELVNRTAEPEPLVKVGDTVVFPWNAGQELLIEGDRRIMLHQDDLLAVVEGV